MNTDFYERAPRLSDAPVGYSTNDFSYPQMSDRKSLSVLVLFKI